MPGPEDVSIVGSVRDGGLRLARVWVNYRLPKTRILSIKRWGIFGWLGMRRPVIVFAAISVAAPFGVRPAIRIVLLKGSRKPVIQRLAEGGAVTDCHWTDEHIHMETAR